MAAAKIQTYDAFWLFYLREHANAPNRWLHFFGTHVGVLLLFVALGAGRVDLMPLALVPSYGLAWIGHFGFEKNRPATFKHPLWSLISDFRMVAYIYAGRLESELAEAIRAEARNAATSDERVFTV